MKVKIQSKHRLQYETPWACAFDFKACKKYFIGPWQEMLIETDTAIEVPEWYMLMLAPRSSTYKKYGLILLNSVWIIDQDYNGPTDTIKFFYKNISSHTCMVHDGERIGQWAFVRIDKADFEYTVFEWPDRWSFWTTWV